MPARKISIVIPSYNSLATLRACIESIFDSTTYKAWELIVVDDGSNDGTAEYLDSLENVKVIHQSHQGIARALNCGFEAAGNRDVIRVHSDVVIETPDWIEKLIESAALPGAGIIGGKLVYPDDRICTLGRNILTGVGIHERFKNRKAFEMDHARLNKTEEVDAVSGALAYYSRKVIKQVGGIDENYFPAWSEDDDFCIAARVKGFKVYVNPTVKAVHYTRSWSPTSQIYFQGSESIVNTLNNQKQPVVNYHFNYWETKWGWNPRMPDLNEIRRLYGDTELCWQIGSPMLYQASSPTPMVDACFVTWNNLRMLKPCLESLAQTDYPHDCIRVFIADNSSTDGTLEYLDEIRSSFPFELTIEKLPVNTGAIIGWNLVIAQGDSDLVARLDDDIILPPDWLKKMVADFQKRPFAGVIGAKIVNNDTDRFVQCGSYRFYPRKYNHWEEPDTGQADYFARSTHVMGCCNLYRRDVLNKCGLFDLRFSPSQWDDPDHHIALGIAGYEVIYDGSVEVRHKVPSTVVGSYAAISNQVANSQKMYGKWGQNIFEILDVSLDLSREGRFLPDDGDTSHFMAQGPKGKDFPRQVSLPLNENIKAGLMRNFELIGKDINACDVSGLIRDHLAQSNSLRRDGKARLSLDVLHTALSIKPWSPGILTDLAESYHQLKQYTDAQRLLKRAARLAPDNIESQRLLEQIQHEINALQTGETSPRPKGKTLIEQLGDIGERSIQSTPHPQKTGKSKLKVLMVNAYENRVAGGDMHQIKKTMQYLEKLGVSVDIDTNARPDTQGYDVVHLWNMWFPHQTLGQVKAIKVSNPDIPILHSTIYWDMSEKTWAELALPQLFRQASSPQQLDSHLQQLARKEMKMDGMKRTDHIDAYPGYERYQRHILNQVDYLLPQSYAEIRNMVKTLGVQKPYSVIRNAAEAEIFDKATPDWFTEHYGFDNFIIMIGLVETRKNQLMVLYALKDMGIPLVFVGRNYDRSYMQLCEKYAPADTLFLEHIPHENLASALKAARVHVLPSWMECASFANVEAALAGCSLVVSDRTSEPEYFQDDVYYCDPADVDSIRQAVRSAYDHYDEDASKRDHLRQLFLEDYTWEKVAQDTLQAYEQVLEMKGKHSQKKGQSRTKARLQPVPACCIILHARNSEYTSQCLQALEKIEENYQLMIVDDGAHLPEMKIDGEIIRHHTPMGAARSYNEALVRTSAETILLISDHVILDQTCFRKLSETLQENPKNALVNPMLVEKNGLIRQAGIHRLTPIETLGGRNSTDPQVLISSNLAAACGEILMARRDALEKENWLDESLIDENAFLDISLKIRSRGLDIVYAHEAVAHTLESHALRFSTYALKRFNHIWKGSPYLPLDATYHVPTPRQAVHQETRPALAQSARQARSFEPHTLALYRRLLDAEDVMQAIEQNAASFDRDLLALVRQEEQLSRSSGDNELAGGLTNLAQIIEAHLDQTLLNSSIPAFQTLQSNAADTLQNILSADDIFEALHRYEAQLNPELLQLIRLNAQTALNDDDQELSQGLIDLADYIESMLQKQKGGTDSGQDGAATLQMLLDSENILEAINNNPQRITPELLDVVLLNASRARDEQDQALSEGLEQLAAIIRELLSRR